MRSVPSLCSIVTILSLSYAAQGAVLTFEGEAPGYISPLTNYGGFTWTNFLALNNSPTLDGTQGGYVSGAVSPNTVAYTNEDGGIMTRSEPFNFDSVYLSSAFNDDMSITVEGFKLGSLHYTTTVTVSPQLASFFNFNYADIDELRFTAFGGTPSPFVTYGGSGTHLVMDNFEFSAAVPEPATGFILPAALLCGSLFCHRRRIPGLPPWM